MAGHCQNFPRGQAERASHGEAAQHLKRLAPRHRGESLVLALDQQGIAFSSGSACRSGSPKPSHALLAMGLSEDQAHCAIRLSLGLDNTPEHIARTLAAMATVVHDSLSSVRFVPCR